MYFDPEKYHRRSIRLFGYDYREVGYYFITICTENRLCLFGEIKNNEMILNNLGKIVEEEWKKSEMIRAEIELDAFVIMPNHVHGIVRIKNDGRNVGANGRSPLHRDDDKFRMKPKSISSFISGFKSIAAKRINIFRDTPGSPVWQRNYYEHIIREENDYNNIRQYIMLNPLMWDRDKNNVDGFH